MLHQIQRFDPVGVGARDLGECLRLQLDALPDNTPGKALAARLAGAPLERLPRIGVAGVASELKLDPAEVEVAVQLLRSLDPRPGSQIGARQPRHLRRPRCCDLAPARAVARGAGRQHASAASPSTAATKA